jgi:hypothetical protein
MGWLCLVATSTHFSSIHFNEVQNGGSSMSSEAPQGIKISAYLFFAAAVLWLIIFCGLLGFLGLTAADTGGEAGPLIGFGFAACFSLLAVVLYGFVGYGLLGLPPLSWRLWPCVTFRSAPSLAPLSSTSCSRKKPNRLSHNLIHAIAAPRNY